MTEFEQLPDVQRHNAGVLVAKLVVAGSYIETEVTPANSQRAVILHASWPSGATKTVVIFEDGSHL